MSSKISDPIKPLFFKNDIVDPHDQRGKEKKEGEKDNPHENAEVTESDVVFFSIEAISAILKQENTEEIQKLLLDIDSLRENGITDIPVRQEQSILSAITESVLSLKEK